MPEARGRRPDATVLHRLPSPHTVVLLGAPSPDRPGEVAGVPEDVGLEADAEPCPRSPRGGDAGAWSSEPRREETFL